VTKEDIIKFEVEKHNKRLTKNRKVKPRRIKLDINSLKKSKNKSQLKGKNNVRNRKILDQSTDQPLKLVGNSPEGSTTVLLDKKHSNANINIRRKKKKRVTTLRKMVRRN
jgi:hypothetical protein